VVKGALCDVNENYSCELFDIEIEHCVAANYETVKRKMPIYHFTDKCIISIHKKK
jgi:hypothetical protein